LKIIYDLFLYPNIENPLINKSYCISIYRFNTQRSICLNK
jgi:hypothetical protein